jgi:hypothetical protein
MNNERKNKSRRDDRIIEKKCDELKINCAIRDSKLKMFLIPLYHPFRVKIIL